MNKKILVTGATGFIGSQLVIKLASTSNEVSILVRRSSDLTSLAGVLDRVRIVYGDITDRASLGAAMEGIEQVYHSAGLTYMGDRRNEQLYRINVEGTRNLLDAAASAGVERIVHVSSITAVGIAEKNRPVDETTPWNFDTIDLEYARTKHLGEIAVADAVSKGLDCVIVNPAFVFGAGDINFNAGRIIKDVYNRRLPFYPLGGICVVDVDIVAETIIAAMQKGRTGERYIIGGDNVTYRELADTISRVTGAPRVRFPLPFALARLLKALLGRKKDRSRISKLFNLSMFRVASEFLFYRSDKARRELGMRTAPHEESIRKAFEWYRERDMLD
ncbi:SDR family oxidoreductase [Chlorobium sp. N1]|uniref:SDR family oxidoreductase n=1 Tax=Chlorobium sp. N1 TaxID=2491138 RepID=UPI00103E5450|nr:SDR family oxidoreductase [Chlorobium sp. N1]TCD48333.1 SDR family NAD(P)-dependent oxidoreductase [Chlorobium sp. N1]